MIEEDNKNKKRRKNENTKASLKYVGISIMSSFVLFFFFGIPTAMIPNPFFTRMTPVSWYDWLILILTSLLAGVYIGFYYYKKQQQNLKENTKATCAATSGSFLGLFSFGCAICNKLLVFILGLTGVLTYFVPIQPYVGVLSVGLLSYGVLDLLKK